MDARRRSSYALLVLLLAMGALPAASASSIATTTATSETTATTTATATTAACSNTPTGGDTVLRAPYLPREAEAALQAQWATGRRSGDLPRTYLLYVPASVPPGEVPIVMTMHGLLGNARQHLDQTGWARAADRHGFVLVAPNGRRNWDNSQGGIDTDFLRDVIADVRNRGCIDGRRIYATGHSNGGFMTHRLACEDADLFAAGASYAAGDVENKPQGGPCAADRVELDGWEPMPLGLWHGTEDTIVDYAVGRRGLGAWLERYDCDTAPARASVDEFGATEVYDQCARPDVAGREAETGTPFEISFRTFDGHGHAWPDGCGGLNAGTGGSVPCDASQAPRPFPVADDLTEELWAFLSGHVRATPAPAQQPPAPDVPAGPDVDDTTRWVEDGIVSGIDSAASFHRVDAAGRDLTGTRPEVTAGTLRLRVELVVRTGGDGARIGPSHPACPTASPGPSTQTMPGRAVTLSVTDLRSGATTERRATTVLVDGREVAEAAFTGLPHRPNAALALRARLAPTVAKWWWVCGTPPGFFKETVVACAAHPVIAGACLGPDPA